MSDEKIDNAGPSTDQHITMGTEEGTFQTDRAPSSGTQADGSSNAGINERKANLEKQDLTTDERRGDER